MNKVSKEDGKDQFDLNPDIVERFFGVKVPPETKRNKLFEVYKEQLQKLDL